MEIRPRIVVDRSEMIWNTLIDEILNGNVIPVIGADLWDADRRMMKTVMQTITDSLEIKSDAVTFSELAHDPAFLIHREVKGDYKVLYEAVVQAASFEEYIPNDTLKKLLSIRELPFVITTSYWPTIEKAMEKIWGKSLKVYCFNNDSKTNQDVTNEYDINKPGLFYMFGSLQKQMNEVNRAPAHRVALTDYDMLNFCSSWLSEDERSKPKRLVSFLKDKFLLMLGNGQSDWLFRFIWFSLRKEKKGQGLYANSNPEDALYKFLEMNNTFMKEDPKEVVDEIVRRLAERKEHIDKFDKVEQNADVFISYSRRDAEVVERLYNALTSEGLSVWYDKKNLFAGDKFMEEIKRGIHTAKYFIPLCTLNIEREKNEEHVYRDEWNEASLRAGRMGRKFIIPIAEKGFDFYRASATQLSIKDYSAVFYNCVEDIDKIAKEIVLEFKK